MSFTTSTTAAAEYVRECEEHLRDLPPDVAAQLRQDVVEIVTEVCAELDGSPRELIGPPLRFVAELRAAAGHPLPTSGVPTAAAGASHQSLWSALRALPEHRAVRWVRALWPDLAPAWWVARGYLVAVAAGQLTGSSRPRWLLGLLPYWPVLQSRLVGLLTIAACVYASVEAARRPLPRRRQVLRMGASVVAALTAIALLGDLRSAMHRDPYGPPQLVVGAVDSGVHRLDGGPGASASGTFDLVRIGSDVTGGAEPMVDLATATAEVDRLLVDGPPAAIYIERSGERVYPGTREKLDTALRDLVDEGLLNP